MIPMPPPKKQSHGNDQVMARTGVMSGTFSLDSNIIAARFVRKANGPRIYRAHLCQHCPTGSLK